MMTGKILLLALGTRGDVQPMIALGRALASAGYAVQLMAGSSFEGWVRGHGLDFVPTIDIEAVMKSEFGLRWTESQSQFGQLRQMRATLHEFGAAMIEPLIAAAQAVDLIIPGFVGEPFIQTLHEKFGVRVLIGALQPYLPSRSGAASIAALVPRGESILNQYSGRLGQRLIWWVAAQTVNQLRAKLGLPLHTAASYYRAAATLPVLYAISPAVLPKPADWGEHIRIGGYWFLDEPDYQPPADLAAFLDAGAPPVYIGYGSSVTRDPQQRVDQAAEALRRAGQRGIFLAGWSGADPAHSYDHVKVIHGAPHGWLFPRMAALVHHGGAGTTAAGLRAGIPALIIPQIADQPYWGRRLYELGVGPQPIPNAKVTVDRLAAAITQMMTDDAVRRRAHDLGAAIRAEDGLAEAVRVIREVLAR